MVVTSLPNQSGGTKLSAASLSGNSTSASTVPVKTPSNTSSSMVRSLRGISYRFFVIMFCIIKSAINVKRVFITALQKTIKSG